MEIRRIRAHEGPLLRAVRLTALADTPHAFGSSLAREQAYTDRDWDDWAGSAASGDEQVLVLALDRDEVVGLAGGFIDDGGEAKVISMWVRPTRRNDGLGRALLEEILTWARSVGAPAARLSVTAGDSAATRLYSRLGFVDTNDPGSLAWNPEIPTRRLRLPLGQ